MGYFRNSGVARVCALGFVAALAPAAAQCGAWPKAPGEGLAILAATWDTADRGYDDRGRLSEDIRYDKAEVSLFGEFGLTQRFTLVGRAAWQDVTIQSPGQMDAASGFAATEAGLRGVVMRRSNDVLSLQATVVMPGEVENVSDLSLGEGGWDYEARVLYGRGFRMLDGDAFAEAQAGWRVRGGAPPDEARLDLTLGWRRDGWSAMGQAFAIHASGATRPRRNYENLKLQASVARDIGGGAQIQLGVFRTVWGRSIVQETAVFAAVWRSF